MHARFDETIHQPARLHLMALLHRNRVVSLARARHALGLTPGNLSSHAARLEAAGYVRQTRDLTPRGFQVRLRITPDGDAAFRGHVQALRAVLGASDAPPGRAAPGPGDVR